MTFEKIIKDIKNLKIQGATNVARSAAHALNLFAREYKQDDPYLKRNLGRAKELLSKTRPTEPAMRNSINYILHNLPDSSISEEIEKRAVAIQDPLEEAACRVYTRDKNAALMILENYSNGLYLSSLAAMEKIIHEITGEQ